MNIPAQLAERIEAGFGPAPTPAAPSRSVLPSRAAAGVLAALAGCRQPVTAADLAASLGQHPNTAREHLDALVEAGLAMRERAPSAGRGRPAWLYAAKPAARGASTEYAGLARALATQLARTSSSPQDDAVEAGRAWGAELASGPDMPAEPSPTPVRARHAVVDLLSGLGFDPEADPRALQVRLRRCPLLDAALEHPEVVCAVHLGIVRGALDEWGTTSEETSLVPFAEPGACVLSLAGATSRSTT